MKIVLGALALISLSLAGCVTPGAQAPAPSIGAEAIPQNALNERVAYYAGVYGVPESLIHRSIRRESGYNPIAHHGPFWGLMQIRYDTARSMGYGGPASGLLEADTNLRYGVKYLAGAYMVGNSNADQAVRNYAHGYYYAAKRKGMLGRVGLR